MGVNEAPGKFGVDKTSGHDPVDGASYPRIMNLSYMGAGGERNGNLCVPRPTTEKMPTTVEFKPRAAEQIFQEGRSIAQWLEERADDPNSWRTEFKASLRDTQLESGSVFHGLPESVRVLNESLGKTFQVVGLRSWALSVVTAFTTDTDWLTKTASAVGIVPVMGDLMGFLDGAVHGNWGETGLSGLGLLVVLAGEEIPVVGDIFDLALGIYQIGAELWQLVAGAFQGNYRVTDQLRMKLHSAWKQALLTQCDPVAYPPPKGVAAPKNPIIPAMEEGWRRYEQGILSSFALTIAMVDIKAEQVIGSAAEKISDADKSAVAAAAADAKRQLWEQLGLLLADAAVSFQAQAWTTLRQMLTDTSAYNEFVDYFVEQYAHQEYLADLNNCAKDPEQSRLGTDCRKVAETVRQEVLAGGATIKAEGIPQIPQEIFALLDINGRFFPRVLPIDALPAPHISAIDIPLTSADAPTLHWFTPKTLAPSLLAKCIFEARQYDDAGNTPKVFTARPDTQTLELTQGGQTASFQYDDPQKIHACFRGPDLSELFPPPEDTSVPIDRQVQSPISLCGYRPDGSWKHWWVGDVSKSPQNCGYGAMVGRYVFVSGVNGMAMDLAAAVPKPFTEVVQKPLLATTSQDWSVDFGQNAPGADEGDPSTWKASAVINASSEQGAALALGFSAEDRLVLTTTPESPAWLLNAAADGEGFTLRNRWEQKNVAAQTGSGDQLKLAAADASAPNQRWSLIPAGRAPKPGSYYVIIHEKSGLLLDIVPRPGLGTPDSLSLTQVFQIAHRLRTPVSGDIHAGPGHWFLVNPATGTPLIVDDSAASVWTLRYLWAGAYQLILQPVGSEKALDTGPDCIHGAPVYPATPDADSITQRWRLQEIATNLAGDEKIWCIGNPDGLVLGMNDIASSTDTYPVTLQTPSGEGAQLWTFFGQDLDPLDGGDLYTLECSGGRLGVSDGEPVLQTESTGASDLQRWKLCPTPAGLWIIQHAAPQTELHNTLSAGNGLDPGHVPVGTPLELSNFEDVTTQSWFILPRQQ